MKHHIRGTVSEGTLKLEDLIPKLCDILDHLSSKNREELTTRERIYRGFTAEIRRCVEHEPGYFKSDLVVTDYENLHHYLNDFAPEGYYFGAHPGDGADIGFWPNEED